MARRTYLSVILTNAIVIVININIIVIIIAEFGRCAVRAGVWRVAV